MGPVGCRSLVVPGEVEGLEELPSRLRGDFEIVTIVFVKLKRVTG